MNTPKPTAPVLVYIAGRYRSRYGLPGRLLNIFRAWLFGRRVARAGAMPVVPHCLTPCFDGIQCDGFFLAGTLEVMRRCDALIMMPDWQRSAGACEERAEAERLGMPVFLRIDELKDHALKGIL